MKGENQNSHLFYFLMNNLLFLIFIVSLIGCSGKKSYFVCGTILEVRKESNEFLIHHDEIPNFMMAMTMPFYLQDSTDIQRFSVGDSVHFHLIIEKENTVASNFQLKGQGIIPDYIDNKDDQYTPIEIGEIIENATFLDLDSHNVALTDTDGKFRFISYIFTRCPMPNMCPAVVAKNRYLSEAFTITNKIEFIIISFDYIYDTPSVMKAIYSSHTKSNPNMKFYSSFGHLNDIFMLAGQSFVSFWGVDENDIGHSLRSIIIDPERRLVKSYDGTDWDPESAEQDIRNLLKAYH